MPSLHDLDKAIDAWFAPFGNAVADVIFASVPLGGDRPGFPVVLIVLLFGAIWFTIYFRGINIRLFRLATQVARGHHATEDSEGEVGHFQAIMAALSGTLGLGNIAGVALAVTMGGPGATFWMIIAGLLGMSTKFVECTLGVRYRRVDNGVVSGGPMYYLSEGLKQQGRARLGKILAGTFAVMGVGGAMGGGNMFQVNQSFRAWVDVTGGDAASPLMGWGWAYGLILAVAIAAILIGGIKSIVKVTDKLVPLMVGIYMLAGIVVLIAYFRDIPAAAMAILHGAFNGSAVAGGFLGAMIAGFRRACFSNEAGIGVASIAHAAVKTDYPASEGVSSLLEPFIDTVIVCTMTALVIIVSGMHTHTEVKDGVVLTRMAFTSVMPWFQYILATSIFFFALSTIITYGYYGLKSWTYLFGHSRASEVTFKVLFSACVVLGSATQLSSIINFTDAMLLAMAFPNVIGLLFLAPEVKWELNRYLKFLGKEIKI